jgi:ribonucleoside-triphosphate reductase
MGENIQDPRVVARLVQKIATNYHIPYFTLTPTFSICPVHGYIFGLHETCPYDAYSHKADNSDLNE